ncbi:hypothetical protein CIK52_18050 [Kocuria rosea]|nr:hypothetical protein CIK52_18050 [Kocuria rosea]
MIWARPDEFTSSRWFEPIATNTWPSWLFGSMVGRSAAFMAGLHAALVISAGVLLAAAALVWIGASSQARP